MAAIYMLDIVVQNRAALLPLRSQTLKRGDVIVLKWCAIAFLLIYCVENEYAVRALNCRLDGGDWKLTKFGGECRSNKP